MFFHKSRPSGVALGGVAFVEVDIGEVHQADAAGGGVVAGEVPVAGAAGYGGV